MTASLQRSMPATIETRVFHFVRASDDVPPSDASMTWRGPIKRRPMHRLRVAGALFVALSTFLPILANAQPGGTDSPPSFYAAYKRQAEFWEGLEIGTPIPYTAAVGSGGTEYQFIEYVPWQQMRLTFNLTTIVDAGPILRSMRLLRDLMQLSCGANGLQQRPLGPKLGVAFYRSTDKLMTEVYAKLFDERLIGAFECNQPGTDAFITQISWDTGNRNPVAIIPPHEWRFLVETISEGRLQTHREGFEAFRRKTDALRAKAAVGADVQLMIEDVPGNLVAKFMQPDNRYKRPYAVCALVTEVRGPLVQVQIQSDTFMLPIRKLFPIGRRSSATEMSERLVQQTAVQLACLQ